MWIGFAAAAYWRPSAGLEYGNRHFLDMVLGLLCMLVGGEKMVRAISLTELRPLACSASLIFRWSFTCSLDWYILGGDGILGEGNLGGDAMRGDSKLGDSARICCYDMSSWPCLLTFLLKNDCFTNLFGL